MTRSYLVTLAFILSGLSLKIPFIQNLGNFAEISPSFFWMGNKIRIFVITNLLSEQNNPSTYLSLPNQTSPVQSHPQGLKLTLLTAIIFHFTFRQDGN
jgi:hypothetical protein